MLPDYADIKDAIPVGPLWWDGHGVPRYAPFAPDMLGVYDHIAVLYEIECQSCGERFDVGVGWAEYSFVWGHEKPVLHDIADKCTQFHYGDPPRHGCAGDTENCIDLEVKQAWVQNKEWGPDQPRWIRRPELEGALDLPDHWADLDDRGDIRADDTLVV
jgi:hypothetical protein